MSSSVNSEYLTIIGNTIKISNIPYENSDEILFNIKSNIKLDNNEKVDVEISNNDLENICFDESKNFDIFDNNINNIKISNNTFTDLVIDGHSNNKLKTLNNITISNTKHTIEHFNLEYGYISDLLNLHTINIINNNISNLGLFYYNINNLQILNLNNNKINNIDSDTFSALPNLQVLNLSYNNIDKLDSNIFNRLYNLHTLNLNNNKINNIDSDTFNGCTNLQVLNLSSNNINKLDSNIFSGLYNLHILNFNNNKINNIDSNIFSALSNLKVLYLSYNNINKLDLNIFRGLYNLNQINLNNNNINTIDLIIFNDLLNLRTLNLNNNKIINYPLLFEPLLKQLPKLLDLQIENKILLVKFNEILTKIKIERLAENKNIISHIKNDMCNVCINKNDLCDKTRNNFITDCLPFYSLSNSKINVLNYKLSSYIYFDINNKSTYYLDKNFYLHELPYYTNNINLNNYNKKKLFAKINYNTFNNIPIYYLFSDYNIIFNIFIFHTTNIINQYNNRIKDNNEQITIIKSQIKDNINNNLEIIEIIKTINILEDKIKSENKTQKIKRQNKLDTQQNEYEYNIQLKQEYEKFLNNKIKALNNTIEQIELNNNILIIEKENTNNKKKSKLYEDVLNNIFINDNDSNKFISISYKFNIFNISLLCEKYIEIINLICSDSKDYKNKFKVDNIKKQLKHIFGDFTLSNIYYLIHKYKTSLDNITPDFFESNFIDISNLSQTNTAIIKQESFMNKINTFKLGDNQIDLTDHIYTMLSLEIIIIQRILNEINKNIHEFKNIFLMAILSYRFKKTLLNDTWGFNKQYIYNLIYNNIKKIEFNSETKNENYFLTCIKFVPFEKPIIYDYDRIIYNGDLYGNCMENVILQFLKVIFWNDNKDDYDDDIIYKIINTLYINDIKSFFNDIDNEKSSLFILNWFLFITKIAQDSYDFIRKVIRFEINSTFNNLIIALRKLIRPELLKPNDIDFIKHIINIINYNYTINIDQSNPKVDIIILNTHKTYHINLQHNIHATFDTFSKDLLPFLNNIFINNLTNTFEEACNKSINLPIKMCNLNAYIFYSYANNTNNIFFKNYIKNYININEIIKLFNFFDTDIYSEQVPSHIKNIINNNCESLIEFLPYDVFINIDNYTIQFNLEMIIIIIEQNLFNKFDKNFYSIIYLLIKIATKISNTDKKLKYFSIIINNILLPYLKENDIQDIERDKQWLYLIDIQKKKKISFSLMRCIMSNSYIKDNCISNYITTYIDIQNITNDNYKTFKQKQTYMNTFINPNINTSFWDKFIILNKFINSNSNVLLILMNFKSWNQLHWRVFLINNDFDLINIYYLFTYISKLQIDIIENIINTTTDFNLVLNNNSAVAIIFNCNIINITEDFWKYYFLNNELLYTDIQLVAQDYIKDNIIIYTDQKLLEYYQLISDKYNNLSIIDQLRPKIQLFLNISH